jgi:hypothetical protein
MRSDWTATVTFPCCNTTSQLNATYRFFPGSRIDPPEEDHELDLPENDGELICPHCGHALTEAEQEALFDVALTQLTVDDEPELADVDVSQYEPDPLDEESPWYQGHDGMDESDFRST